MNPDLEELPEIYRNFLEKWTPAKRRVAVVRYDPNWAKSLAMTDPLFLSLVSLHAELTSPFSDVELRGTVAVGSGEKWVSCRLGT